MMEVIDYWQLQVFDIADNQILATGYQRDRDPEFVNGFIMVKDMKGTTLTGFRLDQISGFRTLPVYRQEK